MRTYNISREGGGGLDHPFAEFRRNICPNTIW